MEFCHLLFGGLRCAHREQGRIHRQSIGQGSGFGRRMRRDSREHEGGDEEVAGVVEEQQQEEM